MWETVKDTTSEYANDKLTLDVETDGSVSPSESMSSVGKTLGELWKLFADIDEGIAEEHKVSQTKDVVEM